MTNVLLKKVEEAAPATSRTVTFNTPTVAGREVFIAGVSAAVVSLPAGWVADKTSVTAMHQFVFRLPGASNPGGLTSVVLNTSGSRRVAAVIWETDEAGGAPTYGAANDNGPNDGFGTTNPVVPVSGGTQWGTGLHTFTSDYGVAVFWAAFDITNSQSVVTAVDQGTLIGSARSNWGSGTDEGAMVAVAIAGPQSNTGVVATLNPALTQGQKATSVEPNGMLGYEGRVGGGGFTFGATLAEEVALPGAPSTEWAITGVGALDAQGFTRARSYDVGETVQFAVHSTQCVLIDIYRIGGYNTGWRKVGSVVNTPTSQPAAQTIPGSNGATECSGWANTATWTVPTGAWSGLYVGVARVTSPSPNASYIPFVVRNDARTADIVVKASDTTWGAAYNYYGTPGSEATGKNLYGIGANGSIGDRAYAVSLDRPILTRGGVPLTYWENGEAPLWRYLDKQGFNWKLISSLDLDAGLTAVGGANVLVSAGHDEYWTSGMRTNAESFRGAGGHLIFMSGNEVFWKVRFTDNGRTMWCYKDTMNNGVQIDPVAWTGTWRDTRWGSREPENLLTGTFFRMNNAGTDFAATVSASTYGASPFWRGTTVATGTDLTLNGVLGFEADAYVTPPGADSVLLANTTVNVTGAYADDNGQFYDGNGDIVWGINLFRTGGSGVTAGFGTVQWAWALDPVHNNGRHNTNVENAQAKQAMINLLTDMGAVAATPTAGLVVPTAVGWADYGIGATIASDFYVSDGSTWHRVGSVSAHEAASNPHPEYLKPSGVVAGANITVDTTTTPGSVIIAGQAGGGADHVHPLPTAADVGAVANLKESSGLWSGTQAQYDAIATKDPTVLYVVV